MSRMSLCVALLGLGLFSVCWAEEDRIQAIEAKRVALEDELRALQYDHGPTHPAVVRLQQRIEMLAANVAQGEQVCPQGLLVVIAKGEVGATLKDTRVRTIGGRSFIVGREVEGPKITKPSFVGNVVWIPLDEVIEMIEFAEPPAK
jgi:hypothetical protein